MKLLKRVMDSVKDQVEERFQYEPEFPCVFILGMHRSGTSCLAGMLEQAGLYLGEVIQESTFNKKGNRESKSVVKINNALLRENGGCWYQPQPVLSVPPEIRRRVRFLRRKMGAAHTMWGIKDPRMLFCLDAWRQSKMRLAGTFRHPAAVVRSLTMRDQSIETPLSLTPEDWERLWFQYNQQLVALYHHSPFPLMNFDWAPERYCRVVRKLAGTLALDARKTDFFEPALRQQPGEGDIIVPEHARLYQELFIIAEKEEMRLLQ